MFAIKTQRIGARLLLSLEECFDTDSEYIDNCLVDKIEDWSNKSDIIFETISASDRTVVHSWIIEVCHKTGVEIQSSFLACHIFDKYLSINKVVRDNYGVFACAAILIAIKYCDEKSFTAAKIYKFQLRYFLSAKIFSVKQINDAERQVISAIDWSLSNIITPANFICNVANISADKLNLALYMAEMIYSTFWGLHFSPANIAMISLYMANHVANKGIVSEDPPSALHKYFVIGIDMERMNLIYSCILDNAKYMHGIRKKYYKKKDKDSLCLPPVLI